MTTEYNGVQTSAQGTPSTAAPAGPITPQQATAQLQQLTADRLAGKVLQDDYLARADYLGRLASGEQIEPSSSPATLDERLAQQYDESMRPPASIADYHFPYEPGLSVTPEFLAFDNNVRSAFLEAGVPALLAGGLYSRANELASRLENADPSALEAHVRSSASRLRERWGDKFNERIEAVDALISNIAGKSKLVADLAEGMPWLFADEGIVLSLDAIANRRKSEQE